MTDVLKKLPISINSLQKIVERNMVYVDKTAYAWELAREPGGYFLSRPRRFGKSLFLNTLKELFEGNEQLFRGLFIHDRWDWSIQYPVIEIDFAGGVLQNRKELDEAIFEILQRNQTRLGVECRAKSVAGCFGELIDNVQAKYGRRVVVLVDEYDKPILDNIENPQVAVSMREGVKNFYSVIKSRDAQIQFVFMTGVSRFSKVSLFSGLNQLNDITLSRRFSTVCGYTQDDIEAIFSAHLVGVDRDKLKFWYNGYCFLGEPVYNPYDILLFIDRDRSYRNYWFETGSPSFLIKLFLKNRYFLPDLERIEVSEEVLDSFDVERVNPVTLLFQTGYLTVESTRTHLQRFMFKLKIPNQEVRTAFSDQLINAYTGLENEKFGLQSQLYDILVQGDAEGLIRTIKGLFAGVPWRYFTQNNLPEAEGYYAGVLYAFFSSINAEVIPEDISSHGQVDLTVKIGEYIYIIEVKVDRSPSSSAGKDDTNPALQQIRDRGYSRKYAAVSCKNIFEIGLIFSSKERNVIRADWIQVRPDGVFVSLRKP
ncbi:MAG: hypothetical protein D3904_00230 [Candidatus Electrothrix sp. EH2]|nr:hypothetical protein [Candidatus Electrothrix sp. EH2]